MSTFFSKLNWRWLIFGVFILFIIFGIYNNPDRKATESGNSQSNEQKWVRINSPDGHFSVELPNNAEYSADNSAGSVETYLYSVQEQNDNVSYIVKYENYQPIVNQAGLDLENSNQTAKRNFLKELANAEINKLSASNFSSQFISSHGYEAVRYAGTISLDEEKGNIEGVIILASETTLSVTAVYSPGYSHDLERILNSLTINQRASKWVKVNSPDGHFSVELPENRVFSHGTSATSVEGNSYIASEYHISYIVKREDYQQIIDEKNIDVENWGQEVIHSFLKSLVDLAIDEFNTKNLSTEFTKRNGFDAIKYSGAIKKPGTESVDIEGIIILADKSAYSVVVLYKSGLPHSFERVLNSLVIK